MNVGGGIDQVVYTAHLLHESVRALSHSCGFAPTLLELDGHWQRAVTESKRFLEVVVFLHTAPKDADDLAKLYGDVISAINKIGDFVYTVPQSQNAMDCTAYVMLYKQAVEVFFWIAEMDRAPAELVCAVSNTIGKLIQQKGQPNDSFRPQPPVSVRDAYHDAFMTHLVALRTMVETEYPCGLVWGRGLLPHKPAAMATGKGNFIACVEGPKSAATPRRVGEDHVRAAFERLAREAASPVSYPSTVREACSRLLDVLRCHNRLLRYASTHALPTSTTLVVSLESCVLHANTFVQRALLARNTRSVTRELQTIESLIAHLAWPVHAIKEPAPYLNEVQSVLETHISALLREGGAGHEIWTALVTSAANIYVFYITQCYAEGLHFAELPPQPPHLIDIRGGAFSNVVQAAQRTRDNVLLLLSEALRDVAEAHGVTLDAIREADPRPTDEAAIAQVTAPLETAIHNLTTLVQHILEVHENLRLQARVVSDAAELFTWLTSDHPAGTVVEAFATADCTIEKIMARGTTQLVQAYRVGGVNEKTCQQDVQRRSAWAWALRTVLQQVVRFVTYRYPQGPPWGESVVASMAVIPGAK